MSRAVRVFLDTNALTDLLNNDVPLPPAVLAERCRRAGVELVLAFSNVAGLVQNDERAIVVASHAEALQRFSLSYIRHAVIPESELHEAVDAFGERREPRRIDPYAEAFYGDYELGSDTFDDVILKIDAERTLRFAGLRQQLLYLLADKHGFGLSDEEEQRLRLSLHGDRESGAMWDKEKFRKALGRWLQLTHLALRDDAARAAFVDWLFERPSRAPGWRLFVDSFEALLSEDEEAPTRTDIYDFSNLTIAPYVDALALPARVINFVAKAQRRLMRREEEFDALSHIHLSAEGALRDAKVDLSR
jgi:hypothetical protein